MWQQSPYAPSELRETPFALWSPGGLPPVARRAKGGGAGGIRTLDRALQPYNGLANRRLQPLGHISGCHAYARRVGTSQAPATAQGSRSGRFLARAPQIRRSSRRDPRPPLYGQLSRGLATVPR